MPHVEQMDPRIIRKILEGYTDDVIPEDDSYKTIFCPRCSGNCRKVGPGSTLIRDALPQYHLECLSCGCVFNPESGLIVHLGNLGLLEPAVDLIKG